ncbi:MAG: EAL domain-containing protein [Acidimicrobiales bacterium]
MPERCPQDSPAPPPSWTEGVLGEANYWSLFESGPVPTWVVDCETATVVCANAATETLHRAPRETFLGSPAASLVPPQDADAAMAALSAPRTEAITRQGQWRHLRADGTVVAVETTSANIRFRGREAWLIMTRRPCGGPRRRPDDLAGEQLARLQFDHAGVGQALVATDGRILAANAAFCELVGRSAAELRSLPLIGLCHPGDYTRVAPASIALRRGDVPRAAAECRLVRPDGSLVAVRASVAAVRDAHGKLRGLSASLWDLGPAWDPATPREVGSPWDLSPWTLAAAPAGPAQADERLAAVVAHTSDAVVFLDRDARVTYTSPAMERMFGYPDGSRLGRPAGETVHPDDLPELRSRIEHLLGRPGLTMRNQVRMRDRSGAWHHVETVGTNLLDHPAVRALVVVVRDLTGLSIARADLDRQALRDHLTGLPNRAGLLSHLRDLLAGDEAPSPVSVLLLDLDRFKALNDEHGLVVGDAFLQAVARRVRRGARSSDVVCRTAGDELVVVAAGLSEDDLIAYGRRLLRALRTPLTVKGHKAALQASVGVALARGPSTPEELLAHADAAMHRAKARGGARVELYEPERKPEARSRLGIEADLRIALERRELSVAYQPVVSLASGQVVGAEALLRWQHPRRGAVSPAEIVPVAEETGLIGAIGELVLEEATHQLGDWHRGGLRELWVAVNVSAHQLGAGDLGRRALHACGVAGIPGSSLCIELTESTLIGNLGAALHTFAALHEGGVRIALDDFGTGYSSFAYLRQLPIDVLKLDKSFVDGLGERSSDRAIVEALRTMAQVLGIQLLAEGVERPEQAEVLRQMGCPLAQGYFFARPAGPEELTRLCSGQIVPPGTALGAGWNVA